MKICVLIGTRPEVVKMSPIIKECKKQGLDYYVLHTGQHYSHNLDGVFFEQLGLPPPKYNLKVGSDTEVGQMSKIMAGLEEVFLRDRPSIMLVEGDTTSVLAGALVASKMRIPIGHVEAGLRSYDKTMPEEINRTLVDHCAELLFAPTKTSEVNLFIEHIPQNKVYVVGNTIADVVLKYKPEKRDGRYMLVTVHRQENVDNAERFRAILASIDRLCDDYKMQVVCPMHPRSMKMMYKFGLSTKAKIVEPLGYFEFLKLEAGAFMVLTDSGGVQEETCILGVPCVTLRDSTERPETLDVGANILAGISPEKILECAGKMVGMNGWRHPFGDGRTGEKIIEIIRRVHG